MYTTLYAAKTFSPYARFDWVLLNPQPLPPKPQPLFLYRLG